MVAPGSRQGAGGCAAQCLAGAADQCPEGAAARSVGAQESRQAGAMPADAARVRSGNFVGSSLEVQAQTV